VNVLQHLHGLVGIAHRDIKLDNMMLNFETDKIKVIDFGLGSRIRNNQDNPIDFEGLCGSPGYYPPEAFSSGRYLGDKQDIFALGVVLFTMIFKEYPFFFGNVNS
jgi:serine/threonine protein kinase